MIGVAVRVACPEKPIDRLAHGIRSHKGLEAQQRRAPARNGRRPIARSRPVSRILYRRVAAAVAIHLGRTLPSASCGLPGGASPRKRTGRPYLLLGLAPGGACRAAPVARCAGELLPHRFTLTGRLPAAGGLFSVALSAGHPAWDLPSALPCGVRTFLDPGKPEPRPPGRLLPQL
jgi:hypothetical protein